MYLIENKLTVEGEAVKHCHCPLKLSTSSSDSDPFVLLAAWPVNVMHTIDSDSPLWKISASELPNQRFEIIIILEGSVESTGMTMQVII
jgi:potassium inwardly-rectifying channel subfamily J, other